VKSAFVSDIQRYLVLIGLLGTVISKLNGQAFGRTDDIGMAVGLTDGLAVGLTVG
jgi:hypothetical protein